MTFDSALPELIRICTLENGFLDAVQTALIVRDLRGRLRLAIRRKKGAFENFVPLETKLEKELGAWFEGPLLDDDGGPNSRSRLTRALFSLPLEQRQLTFQDASGAAQEASQVFSLVERRLSKLSWLEGASRQPPWRRSGPQPLVVTFFSFKGGVGRTTLAAAVALDLAKRNKKVIAVDLDLEAPGLGNLLGSAPGPGVLDVIIEKLATGSLTVDGFLHDASALGAQASSVRVMGAGTLDRAYFEKLARLDFVGGVGEATSPVADALSQLMKKLKSTEPRPDFIILDARAGLHDLAGLSLFGLAHLDVIVARDSEQAYSGLELVIELLSRRPEDALTLIVHSMAAADRNAPEAIRSERDFSERVYKAFLEHVYDDEDAPALQDVASHTPWVVRYNERLQRFINLDSIREELEGRDYQSVTDRILELAVPEAT